MRLSLKLSDKTYDTLCAERMMVFFGGGTYTTCVGLNLSTGADHRRTLGCLFLG